MMSYHQAGLPTGYSKAEIGLSLFDLENDIGETTNVKDKYPDIVKKMQALGQKMLKDLGDNKIKGSGNRPAGKL